MEAWTDPAAIDDPAYLRGVALAVCVMASGRPPRAFRVGAVGVEGKANDAHLRLKQCNDENTTAWVAERAPWRYLVLVPMRGADPEAVRAARDELLGSLRGNARAVQPRRGQGFESDDPERVRAEAVRVVGELARRLGLPVS